MPSTCREYAAVQPHFNHYPEAMRLLYRGVPAYRILADRPLLNLTRGAFIFEAGEHLPPGPDISGRFLLSRAPEYPAVLPLKAPRVGIFCGKGVTTGHLWHFRPLEKCGIDAVFLTETDIADIRDIDVITFPSGGSYSESISEAGRQHLKAMIHEQGMGFLGTCGGNVFGSHLKLLNAELYRSADLESYGIPINGYPRMRVTQPRHPAMVSAAEVIRPFYFWGQAYRWIGEGAGVLAVYEDLADTHFFFGQPYDGAGAESTIDRAGVITGHYGRGRVILSGPHPELGEEQVFVDWVLYLAGGSLRSVGTGERTSDDPPDPPPASFWLCGLKEIEVFRALLAPYEKRMRNELRLRLARHQTIGLPVRFIFVDTCDRLERLHKTFQRFAKSPESLEPRRAVPHNACSVLTAVHRDFIGLMPLIEPTLKALQQKENAAAAGEMVSATRRADYPETYFELVHRLKHANLPLVEIDYALHRWERRNSP